MSPTYIDASNFSRDVVEFLEYLYKYQVDYVIVGGVAVIFYGHARLTGDIDIFYNIDSENADRMFKALSDFWGGEIPAVASKLELEKPGIVFQFGVPPNRIDMMNQIESVTFEEAEKTKETIELRAQDRSFDIHYIGIDALIKNKESVGRSRDLEDLKFLKSRQK